jgi:hypothetical protein
MRKVSSRWFVRTGYGETDARSRPDVNATGRDRASADHGGPLLLAEVPEADHDALIELVVTGDVVDAVDFEALSERA